MKKVTSAQQIRGAVTKRGLDMTKEERIEILLSNLRAWVEDIDFPKIDDRYNNHTWGKEVRDLTPDWRREEDKGRWTTS